MTPADNTGATPKKRPVHWVGSSKDDLKKMPEDVQDAIGKALLSAQWGGRATNATPLTGFRGANVLEIKDDFDSDTYRCVYTVRFSEAIYVLHAFEKKSHSGKKTDDHDVKLIKTRLKAALENYTANYSVQPEASTPENGI